MIAQYFKKSPQWQKLLTAHLGDSAMPAEIKRFSQHMRDYRDVFRQVDFGLEKAKTLLLEEDNRRPIERLLDACRDILGQHKKDQLVRSLSTKTYAHLFDEKNKQIIGELLDNDVSVALLKDQFFSKIGRYQDASQMFEALTVFSKAQVDWSKNAVIKALRGLSDHEASVLLNDEDQLIIQVHTFSASKALGKGSQWCLSSQESDFDYYVKGDAEQFFVYDFSLPFSDIRCMQGITLDDGTTQAAHYKNDSAIEEKSSLVLQGRIEAIMHPLLFDVDYLIERRNPESDNHWDSQQVRGQLSNWLKLDRRHELLAFAEQVDIEPYLHSGMLEHIFMHEHGQLLDKLDKVLGHDDDYRDECVRKVNNQIRKDDASYLPRYAHWLDTRIRENDIIWGNLIGALNNGLEDTKGRTAQELITSPQMKEWFDVSPSDENRVMQQWLSIAFSKANIQLMDYLLANNNEIFIPAHAVQKQLSGGESNASSLLSWLETNNMVGKLEGDEGRIRSAHGAMLSTAMMDKSVERFDRLLSKVVDTLDVYEWARIQGRIQESHWSIEDQMRILKRSVEQLDTNPYERPTSLLPMVKLNKLELLKGIAAEPMFELNSDKQITLLKQLPRHRTETFDWLFEQNRPWGFDDKSKDVLEAWMRAETSTVACDRLIRAMKTNTDNPSEVDAYLIALTLKGDHIDIFDDCVENATSISACQGDVFFDAVIRSSGAYYPVAASNAIEKETGEGCEFLTRLVSRALDTNRSNIIESLCNDKAMVKKLGKSTEFDTMWDKLLVQAVSNETSEIAVQVLLPERVKMGRPMGIEEKNTLDALLPEAMFAAMIVNNPDVAISSTDFLKERGVKSNKTASLTTGSKNNR
jgi:hypothetical protein